jgi:thiol-disulfide isomerase/thioredoxin
MSYPQRASGRIYVFIILAVVLSLLLGGTALYYFITQNPNSSQNTNSYPSTASPKDTTSSSGAITSPTTSLLKAGINDGNLAPNFPITFLNSSSSSSLYSFHGRPILLWFVTTWCSSCQDGAKMLSSQYYGELNGKGVVIITIELYNNLGQNGLSLSEFAQNYGGGSNKPNWYYGYSNQTTTYTFDPEAALDVYFAINSKGVIVEEGIGLPNALQSLSTDSSWFS